MKIKMIIGILIGAILLFLVFGFYQASKLKTIEITRTVVIRSPQENVYGLISSLNRYPEWSPFLAQDPTQQYSVKGKDDTVGAQYHWEGKGGKDLGYQEIVRLEPNKSVGIQVYIQKPFKAAPTFDYSISSKGSNTEVTQRFVLKSGLVDAFFMWVFGIKKEMEATNQQGLELLKKALED
jgi:ribosome-associated toxin RatA of RatAB toxin-antitoxin module